MEFCPVCNNKLYLIEDDKKLFLQCKKCGLTKKNKRTIIISKVYKYIDSKTDKINNKYIVYDNTLPKTNIRECPNSQCISHNNKQKQEAIFYPDKDVRELNYVCCCCFTKWKLS